MKIVITILLFLLAVPTHVIAEAATGDVEYPYLGIKFTIPANWKGAENNGYYVMGSDTEGGLLGITVNSATDISELKQSADQGIIDEGVLLQRSSDFQQIGAEGLGAEFSGQFQGQSAKAFVAGIINPHGQSLSIFALTSSEGYSNRQIELVKEIANSLKFAAPIESPHNQEWRAGLAGRQLTYMSTSSSSGSYYDDSGYAHSSYSSYSSRNNIHLCSNQRFYYSSSSSASFDSQGGFGGANSGGGYEGKWQVVNDSAGNSVLRLNFDDGDVSEYRLDYKDGKTLLNGSRYFRTASDACS